MILDYCCIIDTKHFYFQLYYKEDRYHISPKLFRVIHIQHLMVSYFYTILSYQLILNEVSFHKVDLI